jgi:hypothetical protein
MTSETGERARFESPSLGRNSCRATCSGAIIVDVWKTTFRRTAPLAVTHAPTVLVVARSNLITTLEEARVYYAAKLVGARLVTTRKGHATIVFEAATTHFYSVETADFANVPANERVSRRLSATRTEYRRFDVDRARLMDRVIPAIEGFVFSIAGTSSHGLEKRMLHGPVLPDGRYMRVVLSPWRGDADKWTCVSAYPIAAAVWMQARRAKAIRFP